jgi:demethylmenaquinone methyltransferase/2-methoxy-6-polyprenyl-1,4-benzoquinol methylase
MKINPYFLRPDSIRKLFNTVAPTYDFLNHLLSMRRDCYWRRMAVQELKGFDGWILDIATGTGDVAIEIVHQDGRQRKVFGLDFSEPMIKKAHQKITNKDQFRAIALSLGDALSLPFRENTFSASIIAFGLRNIPDKEKALTEMVRVIKKGGKVIVLEFTFPQTRLIRSLYPIYFNKVLPWVGGFVSGDRGAYAYLPESVHHFPSAETYAKLLQTSGLENITFRRLTFGIASIIAGMKTR